MMRSDRLETPVMEVTATGIAEGVALNAQQMPNFSGGYLFQPIFNSNFLKPVFEI